MVQATMKRETDNTPGCDGDAISLYAVYSWRGLLMDRFDNLEIARACWRRWADAAFVLCGDHVMERKTQV